MLPIEPKSLFFRMFDALQKAANGDLTLYLVLASVGAICGLAYVFFGYRVYPWVLRIGGLVMGALLGLILSDWLPLHLVKKIEPFTLQVTIVVIVALFWGGIAPRLFHLFTFLFGGTAVTMVLYPLSTMVQAPYEWLMWIICFVAGGLLAFLLMRPSLISATSILGGFVFTAMLFSTAVEFQVLQKHFHFLLFYASWFLVAIFGIAYQLQQGTPKKPYTLKSA